MTPAARASAVLPAEAPERFSQAARPGAQARRSRAALVPVYWHLLSLDAPTVAVVWAWSFARAAHLAAPAGELAILGIGTWLIYVLDRILDARVLRAGAGASLEALRERHFFHARHRGPFLAGCVVALVPLFRLIESHMTATVRLDDAALFCISLLYFSLVHVPALRVKRQFPREIVVGVIFAAATALPAWTRAGAGRWGLAAPVLLFAALCTLNCLAIESWERPLNAPRSRLVPVLAGCVAGVAGLLMLAAGGGEAGALRLAGAMLASALLLLALDCDHRVDLRAGDRALSPLTLRVAADAALLTPILLVLPWRG